MNTISEALRLINLQNEVQSRSLLAFAVDSTKECKRLGAVASDFASRLSQPRVVKSSLDPKQVWREWSSRKFDSSFLDARRLKMLCSDAETATQPETATALRRDGEALKRAGCLFGLISSYFVRWGTIQQQEQLEALIVNSLKSYPHRNPIITHFRDHSAALFTKVAAQQLAATAIERRQPPKECLYGFHIGIATNLASSTLSCAARVFDPRPISAGMAMEQTERLKFAFDHIYVPELATVELQAAISKIIVSDWIEKYSNCREAVRQFALHHKDLGDPRLHSKNWSGMDSNATARFLQWIAKESIVFFFNHVLPDNNANRRRKDFWLRYAGAVTDFQVALSEQDYRRLSATSRLKDVPGFGRVDHLTTSAFILRFGQVTIVEFSETGNAAHAFHSKVFDGKAGSLRSSFYTFKKLKHEADEYRILHLSEWEYKARQKLAGWGVRP